MKKHFWKLEYSITIIALFSLVLLLIPTSVFPSKEAYFVSKWNEVYDKVDYMFTAMNAQEDEHIREQSQSSKTEQEKIKDMMNLVQPYLRLDKSKKISKRYKVSYMNKTKLKPTDYYYFKDLYYSDDGLIVGLKDVSDSSVSDAGMMMMLDVNGKKGPNAWGHDIYGINIYPAGQIKALGADMPLEEVKADCSERGTGVFCSHYYRIGGEFNED